MKHIFRARNILSCARNICFMHELVNLVRSLSVSFSFSPNTPPPPPRSMKELYPHVTDPPIPINHDDDLPIVLRSFMTTPDTTYARKFLKNFRNDMDLILGEAGRVVLQTDTPLSTMPQQEELDTRASIAAYESSDLPTIVNKLTCFLLEMGALPASATVGQVDGLMVPGGGLGQPYHMDHLKMKGVQGNLNVLWFLSRRKGTRFLGIEPWMARPCDCVLFDSTAWHAGADHPQNSPDAYALFISYGPNATDGSPVLHKYMK